MSSVYEQYKSKLIIATFLAPVFGGAILYYGLRKHNLPVAKKANTFSWIAFLSWILLFGSLGAADVDLYGVQLAGYAIALIGVVYAFVLRGKIKRASGVAATAAVFE